MPRPRVDFTFCIGPVCFTPRLFPGDYNPERKRGGRPPGPPPPRTPPPPPLPPPPGILPAQSPPVTYPQPAPVRPPFGFPTGPAANDAIYGVARKITIAGPFGILVGVVQTAWDIYVIAEEQRMQRELEEAEEELRKAKQKRRDAQPNREVSFPDSAFPPGDFPTEVGNFPAPRPSNFPIFPGSRPQNFPESPVELPQIRIEPITFPILFPDISAPAPVPKPAIDPSNLPDTTYRPTTTPGNPFPILAPRPSTTPRRSPLSDPINQPIGDPINLTPPNPGGLPSPNPFVSLFNEPSAQPQPQTAQQKCEVVKSRKRKKGKCREGFFRESATGTKYVTWRSRPCTPGRKKPNLKIV